MTQENSLKLKYKYRYNNTLIPLADKIEKYILSVVGDYPRIDRINARAKSVESFICKASNKVDEVPKYHKPLDEIQDQIGARIITFYLSDIKPLCNLIEDNFGPIERIRKEPESDNEFGYEGFHYILFIPDDLITPDISKDECPVFFELQIKTLFQHAWAQAEHDLIYKPHSDISKDFRRKVAFTAAQAWGADRIFDELVNYLKDSITQN